MNSELTSTMELANERPLDHIHVVLYGHTQISSWCTCPRRHVHLDSIQSIPLIQVCSQVLETFRSGSIFAAMLLGLSTNVFYRSTSHLACEANGCVWLSPFHSMCHHSINIRSLCCQPSAISEITRISKFNKMNST